MNVNMRAIVVRSLGDPDVLRIEERDRPKPRADGVVVRLSRAGVNFADTERRRGLYERVTLPWTPGTEGAGVVVETGTDVDPTLIGQRVAVLSHPSECTGTYADYVAAPASRLIRLRDGISDDIGAAFPMQGLTAYHAMFTAGGLRSGETVLVHAAAGGVGLFCVQLARLVGARVLGVVSTLSKADAVREAGGEPLIRNEGLGDAILNATDGRGVDLVLDTVGAETASVSLAALAFFGRLIYLGESSGPAPAVSPGDLYPRSLRVGAYWVWSSHPPGSREKALDDLTRWLDDGSLRIKLDRVVPLGDAAEAHRALESRRTTGKVLLALD